MANPHDAEAGFAPQAADFDGLAGRGQEANAVEARAVFAEIDGIGALGEGMALGVRAFDDDTDSFGHAGLLASSFPKVRDGLFESQTDTSFTVGVRVEIGDANFLFPAAALVDQKNGVTQREFGFQRDEGASGIDDQGLGVFMEGATLAGIAIYHDRHTHGNAFAGTGRFLFSGSREGNSEG